MAKGIGLIGNFKGKVGNTVGYKLSASNTGNTQGIRIYQPIVRNPKTSAQAEQRAKLAPINATYRALKMVIDRGNESLPYGNKSRLAWLKKAFKAQNMPWFEKGANVNVGVPCQIARGSLAPVNYINAVGVLQIICSTVKSETDVDTIGKLSTELKGSYPSLQDGDQITTVVLGENNGALSSEVSSFIIDPTSKIPQTLFSAGTGTVEIDHADEKVLFAVIVSREGANGEHLRSNAELIGYDSMFSAAPFDTTSKAAAIDSYKSSASANSDWAEESIQ